MKKIILILTLTTLLSSCNLTKLTKNKSFYERKVLDSINYQSNNYYDLKQVFFKLDENKEYYVFRYEKTAVRNIYYFVGRVNDEELYYYTGSFYLSGTYHPVD